MLGMAEICRVRTVLTGVGGSPWYSNVYFERADRHQDAINRMTAFWSGLNAVISSAVTWTVQDEVAVIDEETGNITDFKTGEGDSSAGGGTADIVPHALQALVRIRTGVYVGGREVRGRLNVPGLIYGVMAANGNVASGTVDLITLAAQNLLNEIGDSQYAGVWSRKNGVFARTSSVSVWNQFAVLRDRKSVV